MRTLVRGSGACWPSRTCAPSRVTCAVGPRSAIGYVERARLSADPTYYPKAQAALDRARALRTDDDLTLAGLGALAAARHDFAGHCAGQTGPWP